LSFQAIQLLSFVPAYYHKSLPNRFRVYSFYQSPHSRASCPSILSRIQQHAKAGNVVFSIVTGDGRFSKEIVDDGIGMEVTRVTTGIELKNIASRLSVFDGKVDIQSSPGKGFTLSVEIPLQ
jgi:glucose-6-phosphate-specific signal transduction histidine kinase